MSVLRKEADGRWRIARDANLVMSEEAGARSET
jgi:ketosteroid isomerase-like protein